MCRFFAVRGSEAAVGAFLAGEVPERFQQRSRRHTAGWGIAAYDNHFPALIRKPVWVRDDTTFLPVLRDLRAHTAVFHVRRATRGIISLENTHPFTWNQWSFAHNGTIVNRVTEQAREWLKPPTHGQTDSEVFFHLLLHFITEQGSVVEGARAAVRWVLSISQTARLNFVLSDGQRLYAYRRGHTLYSFVEQTPAGPVEGVASDALGAGWRSLRRDWLITLDGQPAHDRIDEVRLGGDEI